MISDHNLVYVCRKVSIPKEKFKFVESRQFKHFNRIKFQEDLRHAFISINAISDPNLAWEIWKREFLKVSDKHAPIRHRKVRSEYKPWLTQDIKKLSYHRDYLKQKAVKLGSSVYNEAYKKCRNYVNRLIKTTKSNYYNS